MNEESDEISSNDEWSTESSGTVSDLFDSTDDDTKWVVDPLSTAPSDYLKRDSTTVMPGLVRMKNVIESIEHRAKQAEESRKKKLTARNLSSKSKCSKASSSSNQI